MSFILKIEAGKIKNQRSSKETGRKIANAMSRFRTKTKTSGKEYSRKGYNTSKEIERISDE